MRVARRQSSSTIEDVANADLVDGQVFPRSVSEAFGTGPPNFDYEAAAFAVELHHQVIDAVRQTSAEMGERADESALPESRHKAGLEGTHHSLAVFGHGARNCPSCRIKSKESSVQLGA
jgi:hypothetical protein